MVVETPREEERDVNSTGAIQDGNKKETETEALMIEAFKLPLY